MKQTAKPALSRAASPSAKSAASRAGMMRSQGRSKGRSKEKSQEAAHAEAGAGRAEARRRGQPRVASTLPPAKIAVERLDPAWSALAPGISSVARKAARAALAAALPTGPRAEIALALGDDALLRRLNRDYRGRDKPTNVLSFPFAAPPGTLAQSGRFLGDVAVARETLLAEAAAEGKPAVNHLSHLIVHGVLHLLGYDHERAADARRMEALERKILAGLGIPDPYRVRLPASRRR